MKWLRTFINCNARFSEEPSFFFFFLNELRLFDWPKYPRKSFPSNFCEKNLVVLTMLQSTRMGKLSIQDQNRIMLPCLGGHTNIMNLPHSCCLCLDVCSKVVELLETLEDTRQSMPDVLLMVVPKLQAFLSESVFFWTFGCCSTLTELDLSRSYIVALNFSMQKRIC
jgi:hypothetical protein